MRTDTQPLGAHITELPGGRIDTDGINDPTLVARSEANIVRWMEYLPEDCIRRMIDMKWDVTT
jgi:hypothetical protein